MYQAWRNGASKTGQCEDLCAFQPGFAPMTSIRWSVRLWQGPGSSECRPGRLRIISLTAGLLKVVLEAYQRPPTPLSILTLRSRLLLPKVRAFVDFLQQHWMRPRTPLC